MTELLRDQNIKKYLNHLSVVGNTLQSTIERKDKSLTRFQAWYTTVYAPTHISDNKPCRELVQGDSSHGYTTPPHSLQIALQITHNIFCEKFELPHLAFLAVLLLLPLPLPSLATVNSIAMSA
jgi:hypothetical protein